MGNGVHDELIRKKDALDALMAERKHLLDKGRWGAEHILTHHGYNVIAELDVPDMNAGDMISRRDATTIPVMPKEHRHYQTYNLDDAYEQGWYDLQGCIENLPPVQPTITHEQAIDYLHKTGWLQNHDRILTESKIVPTVQPKHGKWKPRYYDVGADTYVEWACSECGYVRQKGREDGDAGEEPETDFCEKCGVKMER